MVKSTVTSKGQITIPKEIRVAAMIQEGMQIDFYIQTDGTIVIVPLQSHLAELKGIVKSKRRSPVSLSEMKKAITEGALEAMK